MTSQKRYRHHQDGSNNGARFRDIPPRFKRQKSSSSPTRASTTPEAPKNDIKAADAQEVKSTQSDSLIGSATLIPRDTHFYQFEEKLTSQIRPATEVPPTTQSVISNPTTWQSPQEADSTFPSSPWDNIYHASLNFQEPSHISLGTHFGYKTNGSTMSPWAPGSAAKHDAINNPVWAPAVNNSFADQRIHYPPVYYGHENEAHNQHFMPQHSPGINWSTQASLHEHYPASSSQSMQASLHEHYPASSSPILSSSKSQLPTATGEKVKINKDVEKKSDKRVIDYTDHDVRTIEMLRELERVADQKENENDGFGNDRKSLVSHHLRMLMCAVDRYTEGIEDELVVTSRHDEVTPSSDSRGSTPRVSPAPCKIWPNEQTNETTGIQKELNTSPWPPKSKKTSVWNEPVSPDSIHVSMTVSHAAVSNQNQMPLSPPLLQTSPLQKEAVEIAGWDLWSSPTFDFCDVLMNQNPWDSGIKSEKERKPLYQRQMRDF